MYNLGSRHLFNKSMKKKMGRPRMAKSAKTVLIGARFGPEEAKQVNEAVIRSGEVKSEWLRGVVLGASRPPKTGD